VLVLDRHAEAAEQERKAVIKEISKRRAEAIMKNPPAALYLINGVESSKEEIQKLDPARIKRVAAIYIGYGKNEDEEHAKSPWGKEMIARYGEKVKSGIIEFFTE